jgi:mannosyltransferase OCH1-like enzyme
LLLKQDHNSLSTSTGHPSLSTLQQRMKRIEISASFEFKLSDGQKYKNYQLAASGLV